MSWHSQSVPQNAPQTVAVTSPIVKAGVGYTLQSWSNGATTPATSIPVAATNVTATATFGTACYLLTLDPTPVAGGTATVNPATGGLAGFPNNCYAPGTTVTLTSQPANGYGHNSFGGDVTGTSQPTTIVTMNAAGRRVSSPQIKADINRESEQ